MGTYRNTCGDFAIDVSEPHPRWVTIRCRNHLDGEISGFTTDGLFDLKHLIDRAIHAVEAAEAERNRRS